MELTIVIKTFDRPNCLIRTCRKIREFHREIPIIIIDDGPSDSTDFFSRAANISYFRLNEVIGISEGRNRGVDRVETPYVLILDDDTQPSSSQTIPSLLDSHKNNNFCLTGSLQKRFNIFDDVFHGLFRVDESTLYMHHGKMEGIGDNALCHYVHNSFIADTDFLADHRWDSDLFILEHWDFFYRMYLNSCPAGLSQESVFEHYPILGKSYKKIRFSRENSRYKKLAMEKHGITALRRISDEYAVEQKKYVLKQLMLTARGYLRK